MSKIIYKVSDGSVMNISDLMLWLAKCKFINPEYSGWDFDDITGGSDSFFEYEDYIKMKKYFEENLN